MTGILLGRCARGVHGAAHAPLGDAQGSWPLSPHRADQSRITVHCGAFDRRVTFPALLPAGERAGMGTPSPEATPPRSRTVSLSPLSLTHRPLGSRCASRTALLPTEPSSLSPRSPEPRRASHPSPKRPLDAVAPRATLAMNARAAELRARGVDVFPFGVGEPDFEPPAFVLEAAKVAIDKGASKYTAVWGSPR